MSNSDYLFKTNTPIPNDSLYSLGEADKEGSIEFKITSTSECIIGISAQNISSSHSVQDIINDSNYEIFGFYSGKRYNAEIENFNDLVMIQLELLFMDRILTNLHQTHRICYSIFWIRCSTDPDSSGNAEDTFIVTLNTTIYLQTNTPIPNDSLYSWGMGFQYWILCCFQVIRPLMAARKKRENFIIFCSRYNK